MRPRIPGLIRTKDDRNPRELGAGPPDDESTVYTFPSRSWIPEANPWQAHVQQESSCVLWAWRAAWLSTQVAEFGHPLMDPWVDIDNVLYPRRHDYAIFVEGMPLPVGLRILVDDGYMPPGTTLGQVGADPSAMSDVMSRCPIVAGIGMYDGFDRMNSYGNPDEARGTADDDGGHAIMIEALLNPVDAPEKIQHAEILVNNRHWGDDWGNHGRARLTIPEFLEINWSWWLYYAVLPAGWKEWVKQKAEVA